MAKGKSIQVSFRAKEELALKLQRAARLEDLTTADFARKLVRFALGDYESAGSLHALRKRKAS